MTEVPIIKKKCFVVGIKLQSLLDPSVFSKKYAFFGCYSAFTKEEIEEAADNIRRSVIAIEVDPDKIGDVLYSLTTTDDITMDADYNVNKQISEVHQIEGDIEVAAIGTT